MKEITVTGLYCHPLKSGMAVSLDEAVITPTGILHDRELMLVDAATLKHLNQSGTTVKKDLSRMAVITAEITDETAKVSALGEGGIEWPLVKDGSDRFATVYDDVCPVVDQGDRPAGWVSDFLDHSCRVVRMAQGHYRRVDSRYAKSPDDHLSFADKLPFLLTSEESLKDLNYWLQSKGHPEVPMDRFRPNMVVSGAGAWGEDYLAHFRLNGIEFFRGQPCGRCLVTTIDQETGSRCGENEPLFTLGKYRTIKWEKMDGTMEQRVIFGQRMVHQGTGIIRIGDRVEALEQNNPKYVFVKK